MPVHNGEGTDDDRLSLCYFKNRLITHVKSHAFLSIHLFYFNYYYHAVSCIGRALSLIYMQLLLKLTTRDLFEY